ncbi:UV-stimulated scaffold protein A-like [Bolinopsis microptera]|uniref:UV-stimulated scaffold protein A-like n=1 Tax=Bolinopsis microptera TaxID=2820187 RepID=UPI003079222D
MNLEKWNEFQRIVLKVVKTGDAELNPTDLKELKSLCKKGLVPMPDVFGLVINHLQTEHCQVRISSFQILDELFHRSHAIRELTLERLKTIVSLTLALELSDDLPPPRKFQSILKQTAIKAIDTWNEKFGAHYNKLRISYNFLRSKKNVDFKKLIARTNFEQKQEEKRQQQEKRVADYTVSKTLSNFEMQSDSFKDCIFEANTCFDLLIPMGAPETHISDNSEIPEAIIDNKTNSKKETTPNFSITVDHSQKLVIKETSDNNSVIQVLDDRIYQARKSFIPRLDAWIEELIKNDGEQKEVLPLIKMKERLNIICNKHKNLVFKRTSKRKRRIVQKEVNESDDSDFEEVDDDNVLETIPEEKKLKLAMAMSKPLKATKTNEISSALKTFVADDEQPCSSTSCLDKASSFPQNNSPQSHIKAANKMKDVMKSDAEDDESDFALQQYAVASFESLHRFWAQKDIEPEPMDIDTVRALNPKYCNVPGKFEAVVWSCRAPMKSGKTCPRMDRHKCPLHGKVIPRDKVGKPNGKSSDLFSKSELLSTKKSNGESWEEVEKEIEKLTGEKLNYSKIKKKREVKPTNLVSLTKTAPVTARNRIEKKIMNPRALKAVSKSADKVANARNKNAFDQQFNYSM